MRAAESIVRQYFAMDDVRSSGTLKLNRSGVKASWCEFIL